ncbi:MAG: DUF2279 domain-containing protein [Novosphingobium sp.]
MSGQMRGGIVAASAGLALAACWSGEVQARELAVAPLAWTPISYRLEEQPAQQLTPPTLGARLAANKLSVSRLEAGFDDEALAAPSPALAQGSYGPVDEGSPAPISGMDRSQYRSFGSQVGAIKWEMAAAVAYYTAVNGSKLTEHPIAPHVQTEGYFGRSTRNLGVDKLAHVYSGYVVSEILYARLKRKTGNAPGIQFTAAALGLGIGLYSEFWDSIERSGGWSWEDVSMDAAGAAFSILRNSVPGLDRKLDYRLMIVPGAGGYRLSGKRHFEAQRYFFALKLSGFDALERTPLRFVELHLGYRGKDFTNEDRAAGIKPQRRIFAGVGLNLRELFFKDSDSRFGRAAGEVLDYFQPPYTAYHADLTK